ncbi:NADH oxidase [Stipitochalara longipes BDJ]|nr:NADH oxidase [Stipitochalara longipes BDJ]
MEERLSTWDDKVLGNRGVPTKELINLYQRWGQDTNGWGTIVTGNITISTTHVAGSGDPIITPEHPFSGERFERFQALAAAAKQNGSLIIGQVNHPGRQVREKYSRESISASAVQLEPLFGNWTFGIPHAASEKEIADIIEGFSYAAEYLEKAGFDGVNLHAAHGYLFAQFLSPRTNKRTDAYGGSLSNRMRLIVEVCEAIRRRVKPSFILSIKLNSTDFQEDGFKPEEARELVRVLQEVVKMDFVELSGGTYEHFGLEWTKESTREREAFFLEFAEMIVPVLGTEEQRKTKVFITGGLRSVGAMVKALDVVDGVGLARPATQEPSLASDMLEGKVTGAMKPKQPFDNSSGLGILAAGMQIRMLGDGKEPFNLSDEGDVEVLWVVINGSNRKGVEEVEVVGFPEWKR